MNSYFSMKIGARGQVTIPKPLRQRFGMTASTEVEFVEKNGELILQRKVAYDPAMLGACIRSCVGVLQGRPENIDQFIEEIRGR